MYTTRNSRNNLGCEKKKSQKQLSEARLEVSLDYNRKSENLQKNDIEKEVDLNM